MQFFKFRKWGWLTVLLLMVISACAFASSDQAAMEQAFSERAQRVLDGVFGKGNLIAVVDVSISDPSYAVKYTRQSQAAVSAQKNGGGDKVQILPGYPVIKNLAPDNYKQLPFDSVTNYVRSSIRQINVTVVVNQDFPKGQFGKVQALLEEVLGLKPNRDKVNFNVQKFSAANPKSNAMMAAVSGKTENDGSGSGTLWQILGSALVAVALLGACGVYVWTQQRQQKVWGALLQRMGGGKGGSGGGSGGGEGSTISIAPSMPSAKGDRGFGGGASGEMKLSDSKMKHYFDFVTEATVDKLLFIMKREKLGLENLAVLLPCLSPAVAAQILSDMDLNSQAALIMNMVDPKMVSKAMIEKFEAQLKNAMECLIGGQGITHDVLSHVSGGKRRQLLMAIQQSNAEGYRRIRPLVVLFEDLVSLEEQELKYLMGVISRDLLFTALVGVDSAVETRFVDNMSTGVRNMYREFIELRSAGLNELMIETAREQILEMAAHLEVEGKLSLKSKLQG